MIHEPFAVTDAGLKTHTVFTHVLVVKAELYRAILEVFVRSREQFMTHLRPAEVARKIGCEEEETENALRMLQQWGNLEATQDSAEAAALEEFYRSRFLYALSARGEAAERALVVFEETVHQPGELQTAALRDIIEFLEVIRVLLENSELDVAKLHTQLLALTERFRNLTNRAQAFMRDLQSTIQLHGVSVAQFLEYKQLLIDYLDRFLGELVLATNEICQKILYLEQAGIRDQFKAVARRALADALLRTAELEDQEAARWDGCWHGLRRWFLGEANGTSQAEILRARAREAIPALLFTLQNINDQRVTRSDRFTDWRTLALWFAEAPTVEDTHRLWRAGFGMAPALLSQPLLSAEGPTCDAFALVQKHRDWLRPWFAHYAGWQLMLDSEAARLIKRSAKLNDATRPGREPNSGMPLSRRAYIILCLALASLVRADRQTTLVRLRDSIVGLVRADLRFEAAGVRVELEHQESRRDFVHAIRLLLLWGVLKRVQGEEERFIKDADVDALYNVHRPVLARLLAAHRPPSLVKAQDFPERLRALAEDDITTNSDEARHRRLRVRLFRQLLDDPVLYYDELTSDEREYLDRQRGFIVPEIETATGLVREVRAEGIAMTDPNGSLTDYGLPEEGTDGHITLLLATFLAERLRESAGASVTCEVLVARTREFIAAHHKHWRKNVQEPGQDRALTRMVIERLCALGLARQEGDQLFPLPAIARYGLREEESAELPIETMMP